MSALLALIIGGVFIFLAKAITGMRDTAVLAKHSERVLATANDLERLVVDLETGQRGYAITHDAAFLEPWTAARASFDGKAAQLHRLAAQHSARQGKRAAQIKRDGDAYIREYAVPLVQSIRANGHADGAVLAEAKRRVDRLREEFQDFTTFEYGLAAERDARSTAAVRQAIIVSIGGIGASVLLIAGSGGYLARGVIRPVQRVSRMAGEVARGNLTVRLPETGKAEIGRLERSFNSMAGALERNRDELTASRARIVAAGDAARRRIERDLHDGTQQRLVTLGLELRMAEADTPADQEALKQRLSWTVSEITDVVRELREISRGIHPALLSKGGLAPAISMLARRSSIPVEVHVDLDRRLREPVEVAVYYVVSEALTNVAKHAKAFHVWIDLAAGDEDVRLSIRDDGVGGADAGQGSGIIGLQDRIEALGGEVKVLSPENGGTTLFVWVPSEPT